MQVGSWLCGDGHGGRSCLRKRDGTQCISRAGLRQSAAQLVGPLRREGEFGVQGRLEGLADLMVVTY